MNGTAVTSGGEIAYDKPAVLKITAKSGYVLGKLTVDNQVVNLPEVLSIPQRTRLPMRLIRQEH